MDEQHDLEMPCFTEQLRRWTCRPFEGCRRHLQPMASRNCFSKGCNTCQCRADRRQFDRNKRTIGNNLQCSSQCSKSVCVWFPSHSFAFCQSLGSLKSCGPIFAHCNFLGTCGNLSTATCWFGRPAKPLVAHETCGTLQIWHVWAVLNRLVLSERNLALPWR